MQLYFWIWVGSGFGGVLRYWIGSATATTLVSTFPWGTLIVNVTGSFLIGFIASFAAPEGRMPLSPTARQFLMTGICGGYTTFSSFSLQTLSLVHDGEWLKASGNVAGSVVFCLAAVWLGHLAGTAFRTAKA